MALIAEAQGRSHFADRNITARKNAFAVLDALPHQVLHRAEAGRLPELSGEVKSADTRLLREQLEREALAEVRLDECHCTVQRARAGIAPARARDARLLTPNDHTLILVDGNFTAGWVQFRF